MGNGFVRDLDSKRTIKFFDLFKGRPARHSWLLAVGIFKRFIFFFYVASLIEFYTDGVKKEKDKLEPPKNNNIKAGWLDHYEI